jgi:hypothetical protein
VPPEKRMQGLCLCVAASSAVLIAAPFAAPAEAANVWSEPTWLSRRFYRPAAKRLDLHIRYAAVSFAHVFGMIKLSERISRWSLTQADLRSSPVVLGDQA